MFTPHNFLFVYLYCICNSWALNFNRFTGYLKKDIFQIRLFNTDVFNFETGVIHIAKNGGNSLIRCCYMQSMVSDFTLKVFSREPLVNIRRDNLKSDAQIVGKLDAGMVVPTAGDEHGELWRARNDRRP